MPNELNIEAELCIAARDTETECPVVIRCDTKQVNMNQYQRTSEHQIHFLSS